MKISETTAPGLRLRDVARLHDIERRQYQIRSARAGVTLVALPGLAVCAYVIARSLIAGWAAVTTEHLLGGAVMVITAAAAVFQGVRATRDKAARLEEERSAILAGTADGPFRLGSS